MERERNEGGAARERSVVFVPMAGCQANTDIQCKVTG